MERLVQKFDSFDAADEAEHLYYARMSPEERLAILLEIVARTNESFGEAAERFERVCRVTELERD
jgi:hypothetical protein